MDKHREKLIELLSADPCGEVDCGTCERLARVDCHREQMADYLIANGVTFATDTKVGDKWISVKDRLPNTDSLVLAWIADKEEPEPIGFGFANFQEQRATDIDGNLFTPKGMFLVTHWMPLPEPPKED